MMNQVKPKRPLAALAVAALFVLSAVPCLQILRSSSQLKWGGSSDLDDGILDHDEQLHRYLLRTIDETNLMNEYNYADPSTQDEDGSPIGTSNHPALTRLTSYTLQDAINEADVFRFCFLVMVYDPTDDKFYGYYSKDHLWRHNFLKLQASIQYLSYMLRHTFGYRFTPNSPEFAVAVSSGDYPSVKVGALPHQTGVAPVLQFGSVFHQAHQYPNMISMPMPTLHLPCFSEWAESGQVCTDLKPMNFQWTNGQLVFGKELGLDWDSLKPQLIWRGTDFSYLSLLIHPKVQQPFGNDIEEAIDIRQAEQNTLEDKKKVTAEVLREHYKEMRPRWKGVVLTAESELAAGNETLPWANIKFSQYLENGIKHTAGSAKYKKFEDVGIGVGEWMSHQESAEYKYQIDLAGGGGTTWTGTIAKLAMPGLLFHHITPMKDYFHDRLKPWKHYVPVSPDLSDLEEKVAWAENNPAEAQRIADQATEFVRHLGSPAGFRQMFQEDFVDVLTQIIDAYQPVAQGTSYRDILDAEENRMQRVLECPGFFTNHGSCKLIGEWEGFS